MARFQTLFLNKDYAVLFLLEYCKRIAAVCRSDDDFEKYLVDFCKKTHTDRRYVHSWLPIVAAARMTKHIPEEKELLESMIDVCDYQ